MLLVSVMCTHEPSELRRDWASPPPLNIQLMHRRGEQIYIMIAVDGSHHWSEGEHLADGRRVLGRRIGAVLHARGQFRNHEDRPDVRIVVRTLRFSVKGGATSASGYPLDTTACALSSLPIS